MPKRKNSGMPPKYTWVLKQLGNSGKGDLEAEILKPFSNPVSVVIRRRNEILPKRKNPGTPPKCPRD